MSEQPFKRPKTDFVYNKSYLHNTEPSKRDISILKNSIKRINNDNKISILEKKIDLLNDKTDLILQKTKHIENTITRMNDYMVSHIDALNSKLETVIMFIEENTRIQTETYMDFMDTGNSRYNSIIGGGCMLGGGRVYYS